MYCTDIHVITVSITLFPPKVNLQMNRHVWMLETFILQEAIIKSDVSNANQGYCHWVTFLTKPCPLCPNSSIFHEALLKCWLDSSTHTPMLLSKTASVNYTLVYLPSQVWYNYFYRLPLLMDITTFCAWLCCYAYKLVSSTIIYKNSRLKNVSGTQVR